MGFINDRTELNGLGVGFLTSPNFLKMTNLTFPYCNLLGYHAYHYRKNGSLWHLQWLDIYWLGSPLRRAFYNRGGFIYNIYPTPNSAIVATEETLICQWRESYPHGFTW